MPRLPDRRLGRWAILLVGLCAALAFAKADLLRSAEQYTRTFVSQLAPKSASGHVHIVEVDARSISAIRQWPWPREHYANLVRKLEKAGARSIVFDIDFSSYAPGNGDEAFADAIAETRSSIVLPTFSQAGSEDGGRRIDALPIPELRTHASLATASVRPDPDSRVRRMVYGTATGGIPRPSLSAQIAGAAGRVHESFPIDFGIRPNTIPRHSFVDVLDGTFDSRAIAGRDVLVGATAIELGDRYGVPEYGVIPGVTIQALAAETLLAGAWTEPGWVPALLLASLLAWLIVQSRSYAAVAVRLAASILTLVALATASQLVARTVFDIMPALALLMFVGLAQGLRLVRRQVMEKALVDAETGLPNARAFARASGSEDQLVATAFIKDFDSIRAVIGKEESGEVLARLVERMTACEAAETFYRTDTRIVAWSHSGDYHELIDAFERMDSDLKRPLTVADKRIDVGLAFGIANGTDLAAASRAASHAAEQGKLWHAHAATESSIMEQRVSLMGELDQAIDANELTVLYQPKLCLSTDRIESVEALVRWEHPVRGFLRPDLFIPLAEETNRIESLTLFVLRRTIADLRSWSRCGIDLSAAINFSAVLICSDRFVTTVQRILDEPDTPVERLIFEVTESATMRDPETAARNLRRFRDRGVAISMDDYGTGQSTLSYLQMLPLTELKIDRAFVENAHADRSDALLVNSTIKLAHSLGLRVVGEGIETADCLKFLRWAKCDYAQGYFIAKPLTASTILAQTGQQDESAIPFPFARSATSALSSPCREAATG